ncbi:hypothetical protein ACU4GD_27875 [Cupriavidus basilensis]
MREASTEAVVGSGSTGQGGVLSWPDRHRQDPDAGCAGRLCPGARRAVLFNFTPHNGISKIDHTEARDLVAQANACTPRPTPAPPHRPTASSTPPSSPPS